MMKFHVNINDDSIFGPICALCIFAIALSVFFGFAYLFAKFLIALTSFIISITR